MLRSIFALLTLVSVCASHAAEAASANRLANETSPYLLQHAHNPVDWYPWGDEAFETARELNRPVLLSAGYSTCHWCHVMAEESFEDEEIAAFLNAHYIAVKVDREERPDVDAIYMAAVEAFTGQGGWPMTVWLTPDREPFYAATYLPPHDGDRGVRTGFRTLLEAMRDAYHDQPDTVARNAEVFTERIGLMLEPEPGDGVPATTVLDRAASYYSENFDEEHGGILGQSKFPSDLPIRFLLGTWKRTGDERYMEMAARTLDAMARGGVHDQIVGGFHRYATDERWLVPHFEKMLYDNALLALDYIAGYQATGREEYAEVARDILGYIAREMTSPEGAFYSATDADSLTPEGEREEGRYYTWTPEELSAALSEEQARVVGSYYGVTDEGNFEGRSILHVAAGQPPEGLDGAREALYRARAQRPAPLRDEKILAAWNGLAISAFAKAALVLGEDEYADRAERAAGFLLDNLVVDGRLRRSFQAGGARHNAYLDDYAFLTAGLIDLYEATGTLRWLDGAIRLDGILEEHYEDTEDGAFYLTSDDHEQLLARQKPAYDGAEPSGNSIAVMNLLRLGEFTTDDRYRQRAERALSAFERILATDPTALSRMLPAVEFHHAKPKEIVIVTRGGRSQAEPFLSRLRRSFVPNRILAVVEEGDELDALAQLVPLVEYKVARDGEATAYVCENGICELPTIDPEVFERQINAGTSGTGNEP